MCREVKDIIDFVAVDAGASNTRYVGTKGKIDILPNNMVILEPDAVVELESYDNGIEDNLDVTITSENNNPYFPCRVLVGSVAERYNSANIRMNANLNKTAQASTYISILLATAIKKYKEELTDDVNLYITLPPTEAKYQKNIAIDNLTGKFKVTFNQSGREVEFNVRSVSVFPESYMSIMSFFFEMNGGLREAATKYKEGMVLSLDIGASTTDLAIVKDKRYLDKTGFTIKSGGNITRTHFAEYMKGVYGYNISVESSDEAIAEGRFKTGMQYTDCGEAVNNAKKMLAQTIVAELQTYFGTVGIPLQEIRAVCVSGGGSLAGQYYNETTGEMVQTSRPVSDFIMEELHKISPAIDVVAYGDESRLANIKGLFIRANVDIVYAKRMQQNKQ